MHRFRATALLVLVLVASACSDSNTSSVGTLAVATAIPAATPEGEVVDGFAPEFDQGVVVVGAAAGETLSLRIRPGVDQFVTAEIPGDAVGLTGLGETFETPDGRTWWFVRWEDSQGWIEPGAAYLSAPEDASGEVDEPGQAFDSMVELVRAVTDQFREAGDRVVVVGARPGAGGAPSVTVADVLASEPGDRQIGQRLMITATNQTGSFVLQSIERRALCGRGLTDSGSCS